MKALPNILSERYIICSDHFFQLLAADPSTSSSSSSSSAGGDEDQPVVAAQPKEASANKDVVHEPAKPSLQQQQPDETLKLDKEEAEQDVDNLYDAAAAAETKVNNYRSRQSSISSWKSPVTLHCIACVVANDLQTLSRGKAAGWKAS